MRRTTTRRAASTGLGALAATTALALAAPGASAATGSVVLDPEQQDVTFSAYGFPTDEDQLDELDATLVTGEGVVEVTLPGTVLPGTPTASLVDADAFDEAFEEGRAAEPLELESPLQVMVEDGGLELQVPLDDPGLVDDEGDAVEEVYLVVDGLLVDDFLDAPAFQLVAPLVLDPDEEQDEDLQEEPARVDALVDAFVFVEEPVEVTAGEAFAVDLPESSSLGLLGVEELDDLEVFLLPLEDGDLEMLTEEMSEAGAGAAMTADVTAALPAAAASLAVLADQEGTDAEDSTGSDDGAVALDDEDDLYPDVEGEGRSATVTVASSLEAGEYLAVLFPSTTGEVGVVAAAPLVVTAAAPEPTPTVTVTQPAPTVTAAPPRQNPGLRSNTGVEDAAPGLSGSGLVALGSGLLAVAGVTGAAVARSSRRARG